MWNNIGGKLKGVAKFLCWIGIIGSVLLGISIISGGFALNSYSAYGYRNSSNMSLTTILIGLGVAVGGSLLSWVGSWLTYAFGEITEAAEAYKYELTHTRRDSVSTTPSYLSNTASTEQSAPKKYCPHCGARNDITNKTCFCCNKDI